MKLKLLIGFIVLGLSAVGVLSIAYVLKNPPAPAAAPVAVVADTEEEADIPFMVEKFAQKFKTDEHKKSESQPVNADDEAIKKIPLEKLAGQVNKEFGIREDILRYIEKNIPADNKRAMKVALRIAADAQYVYFKATEEEALEKKKVSVILIHCLYESLPDQEAHRIFHGIYDLMRNTTERDKRMWYVDRNYFGWKIFGYGDITDHELKTICEKGSY